MGLHDNYGYLISEAPEVAEYNSGNVELGEKLYEAIKAKCKMKFNLSDEHVKMIKDAMPSSYHPSAERIKAQAELSEEIHEAIFEAQYDLAINDYIRSLLYATGGAQSQRQLPYFYRYVAEHGSEPAKTKMDELIKNVYKKHLSVEEAKKSELADEDKEGLIEYAKEQLDAASAELDNYGREIAVNELRRAAEDIPRLIKLMDESTTPEKVLENYKEIRGALNFYQESQGYMQFYEDLFDPEEFKKIQNLYGSIHIPGYEFLNRAAFYANPQLAKNIDIQEFKMLSSEDLAAVVEQIAEWEEINSTEGVMIVGLRDQSDLVFKDWRARICDRFGMTVNPEDEPEIDIIDMFSGKRTKFTRETMQKLYENGAPFYAIPKDAPKNYENLSAAICMPTKGYNIAIGEKEIEAAAKEPFNRIEPKKPSGFAMALDSLLSSISSKLRISSVKKYEDELKQYNKEKDLVEAAKIVSNNLTVDDVVKTARKVGIKSLGLTKAELAEIQEQHNKMEEKDFLQDSFNYDEEEFSTPTKKVHKMVEELRGATSRARDLASVSTKPGHTSNFADYFVKKLVFDEISEMKTPYQENDKDIIQKMISSIEGTAKQKLLNETINEVIKENMDLSSKPEELFPLVEEAYAAKCASAEEPEAEEVKQVNNQKADDGIVL